MEYPTCRNCDKKMKLNEIVSAKLDRYYEMDNYSDLNNPDYIVGALHNGLSIGIFSQSDKTIILLYDIDDKNIIGHLDLRPEGSKGSDSYKILSTGIANDYQGQELGYQLYIFVIKELNFNLISDGLQSQGAIKLWTKLWKTSGIHVYGMRELNSGDTEYFEVTPNDFNELEGKYDIYPTRPNENKPYLDEKDFLMYIKMIQNMITNNEITKKEGKELIKKYSTELHQQTDEYYLNSWYTYLVATKE